MHDMLHTKWMLFIFTHYDNIKFCEAIMLLRSKPDTIVWLTISIYKLTGIWFIVLKELFILKDPYHLT